VADPKDENLKGRLVELKSIGDAARADVLRMDGKGGAHPIEITPDLVRKFAAETRRKMRTDEGGYRRHHIQALAQRVDVGEAEVRITGSKLTLLRTLVASMVLCCDPLAIALTATTSARRSITVQNIGP